MIFDLTNALAHINPIYLPFFKTRKRFAVLYGGAGSGKSYAVAQKIIVRLVSEDKHNILCVRKIGSSVVKSQFPLLVGVIRSFGLSEHFDIHKSQGREKITFRPNGNQVIFSGLDDVEKLKSIYHVTSIWMEEASEITVEDFRELNRRLRGYQGKNRYMQIMLSFNPVSHLCWLKDYFFDSRPKTAFVLHTTYHDNAFLDSAFGEEMETLKTQNAYEYSVYALGRWGVTGGSYFPSEVVSGRLEEVEKKKPSLYGRFCYTLVDGKINGASIQFETGEDGLISIYEKPQKGMPYVIGGDTAGGGADYFTAQVLRNTDGLQVAVLRGKMDEDLYAHQVYCLAHYFNEAMVGLETNFSTHPVRELSRLGYDRQVRREVVDSYTGKLAESYGFRTDRMTRPLILSELRVVVRDFPHLIVDAKTLEEMLVFVRNEKGRPEAANGKHDDLVMALAIAWHIREQGDFSVKEEKILQSKKLVETKKMKRMYK